MTKPAISIALMLASAASLFLSFSLLQSAAVGFVLYYLVCCLVLPALDLLALRRQRLRGMPRLVGLGRPRRLDLVVGFGSGAVMVAAMLAALFVFKGRIFGDGRIQSVLRQWGASGNNAIAVYIVMLVFNGAIEELFWRGYLHERLSGVTNRLFALGLPTLFFAGQHVFVLARLVADPALVALMLAGIFGAGAVWSFMREKCGSVVPCAISHTMVTAGYMAAFFVFGAQA